MVTKILEAFLIAMFVLVLAASVGVSIRSTWKAGGVFIIILVAIGTLL